MCLKQAKSLKFKMKKVIKHFLQYRSVVKDKCANVFKENQQYTLYACLVALPKICISVKFYQSKNSHDNIKETITNNNFVLKFFNASCGKGDENMKLHIDVIYFPSVFYSIDPLLEYSAN